MPAERERVRHLRAPRFEHLAESVEYLPAVVWRALRPVGPCLGGGLDGVANVLARALRDVREELPVLLPVLVDGIHAARLGPDERAADVDLGRLRYRKSIGSHQTILP